MRISGDGLDSDLVMGRGLITPAAKAGTGNVAFASVFHQWFIHLANFLERENGVSAATRLAKVHKKEDTGRGRVTDERRKK